MEDVRKKEAWARVENQELRERIEKRELQDDGSVATSRISKASTRAQAALEEIRRKLEVAEQVRVNQVELTIVEMIMKDNTTGFLRRKKHLGSGGKSFGPAKRTFLRRMCKGISLCYGQFDWTRSPKTWKRSTRSTSHRLYFYHLLRPRRRNEVRDHPPKRMSS